MKSLYNTVTIGSVFVRSFLNEKQECMEIRKMESKKLKQCNLRVT